MSRSDWLVLFLMLGIMLIALGSLQTVFGQLPTVEKYETLGIRHSTTPQVCLFEPNPTHVDWDYWKQAERESLEAILDWQTEMTDFLPEGDWTIDIHATVPYIEHWNKTPDDYRHCTIFLTYKAFNEDPDSKALGLTGIDFSKSSHKFTFIVIYLHAIEHNTNIVLNLENFKSDEDGVHRYEINLERKELPLNQIYNITLHEFGHGLGLGHYEKWTPQYGESRSAMYPSLDPFKEDQNFEVQLSDKFMLAQIYGMDGYHKPNPVWLPDHCNFIKGIKAVECN